ncbi:MAG: 3-oxoacid CoA-transferase subunit B [Acidocella sp.]|nr:3-oxoacid CoA-transferase subunit B [Acidocella sp.]
MSEGWAVNLGIGLPTLIANFVPLGREVMFHSENGLIGVGPAPAEGTENPWLINAGKQHVTLRPGASIVGQADSFAIIRGGHLDLCVLGGYQVSAAGDLANWSTGRAGEAPAVGGAMDLGAGARQVWVLMEHVARDGSPKLVDRCSYPLTTLRAVTRVYTNLAVIDVTPGGFVLRELAPGVAREQVAALTGACIG